MKVKTPKGEPAAEPTDAGLSYGPALSIEPGYGLKAWIENNALQVAQGEDVIALSRTEFKALAAQFAEWCGP